MDEAGELHVLEMNPRPGATLDIFDPLAGANLFDLHVAAVAGDLPHDSQVAGVFSDTARACAILYADVSFKIGDGMDWPAWTADHPREGTAFAAGDPVCTVFAEGDTSCVALQTVMERAESLYQGLYGTAPPGVGVQTTDEKLRKNAIS
jgi:predicted ATP-grasp superfamily ATP-dependent carboligase